MLKYLLPLLLFISVSCTNLSSTTHQNFESYIAGVVQYTTIDGAVASGVIIGDDDKSAYILTALHPFISDSNKFDSFCRVSVAYTIEGNTILYYPFRGVVIHTFAGSDLAIIKIDKPIFPYKKFKIAKDQPKLGDRVYAVGSPAGLFNVISEGIISKYLVTNYDGSPVMVLCTDAEVAPGSSGGPLFNKIGEIIGICTQETKDPDLGLFVDTNTLNEWVKTLPKNIR